LKDLLTIAGKSYGSRLLVGTGKYRDFAQTRAAIVRRRFDADMVDPR
jgi:thiazole synthase